MPTENTVAGGFTVYCDGQPIEEITEIHLPEISAADRQEWESISNPICGEIQLAGECNLSAIVAALPIEVRYIWHCKEKGWKPSLRGLNGFIKMVQLGYYKTL